MKIYCYWADTEESNSISKTLHEAGIGWKNIRNEFIELTAFRTVSVPKTKQQTILNKFPQIKQGCPKEWLQVLGITHYWQD